MSFSQPRNSNLLEDEDDSTPNRQKRKKEAEGQALENKQSMSRYSGAKKIGDLSQRFKKLRSTSVRSQHSNPGSFDGGTFSENCPGDEEEEKGSHYDLLDIEEEGLEDDDDSCTDVHDWLDADGGILENPNDSRSDCSESGL